jgi:hypothetical protein
MGFSRISELLPHKILVNREPAHTETAEQDNYQSKYQKQARHRGLSLARIRR